MKTRAPLAQAFPDENNGTPGACRTRGRIFVNVRVVFEAAIKARHVTVVARRFFSERRRTDAILRGWLDQAESPERAPSIGAAALSWRPSDTRQPVFSCHGPAPLRPVRGE